VCVQVSRPATVVWSLYLAAAALFCLVFSPLAHWLLTAFVAPLAIAGVVTGHVGRRRLRRAGSRDGWRRTTVALWLGYTTLALLALAVALLVLVAVAISHANFTM